MNICVFCGANSGVRAEYTEAAVTLGRYLASQDIGLVYGGATVGLMGTVADTVMSYGGKVYGVMPRALQQRELAHNGLTELYIVETMHERKAKMADLSDAFIALPGGAGTMEELFEQWTWGQLGIHQKPCGLLNVQGYYDSLLAMISHMVTEGFLHADYQTTLLVEGTPEHLVEGFRRYHPPVRKWLKHPPEEDPNQIPAP